MVRWSDLTLLRIAAVLNSRVCRDNRVVKLIGGGNSQDFADFCYSHFKILKLSDLYKHETAKFVYRFFCNNLPIPLGNLFVKNSDISNRLTRSTAHNQMILRIPLYTTSKMQRCMKYQGIKIWNSISHEIKTSSFNMFKSKYKKLLVALYE